MTAGQALIIGLALAEKSPDRGHGKAGLRQQPRMPRTFLKKLAEKAG